MDSRLCRRDFLKVSAGSCAILMAARAAADAAAAGLAAAPGYLVSPGCRKTKVRVGKVYMANPEGLWPTPELEIGAEVKRYEGEFDRLAPRFADVEFVGNKLVSSKEDAAELVSTFGDVDGILAIHISMGIGQIIPELLKAGKPTMIFAAPYSGHEWTSFGALRDKHQLLDCILTSDLDQLATAVRPFRAIHHMREAKIINVTERKPWANYVKNIKDKFGTEIKYVGREPLIAAYEAIPDADAREVANTWIEQAQKVVEPSEDEVFRSCKLALAMEKMMNEEQATVFTVDCYGTMFHKLPAFPCIGFSRLNNMGLGGVCESDLCSAMTHILFQAISGRPGFVNDPTMDGNEIILAHCMGTPRMDGPDGPAEPYKLRTIMERREGAVPQVFMSVGRKTTSGKLIDTDLLLYFTGDIVDAPDIPRGCRTKITVKVDGDADKLWHNWSHGLHRVTCYGDIAEDLERFCRFKDVEMVHEA